MRRLTQRSCATCVHARTTYSQCPTRSSAPTRRSCVFGFARSGIPVVMGRGSACLCRVSVSRRSRGQDPARGPAARARFARMGCSRDLATSVLSMCLTVAMSCATSSMRRSRSRATSRGSARSSSACTTPRCRRSNGCSSHARRLPCATRAVSTSRSPRTCCCRRVEKRTRATISGGSSTSFKENAIRGGISGRSLKGRATRSRAIGAIREDVRINNDLWQLAMSMIRG
jgi:hypothetical protein